MTLELTDFEAKLLHDSLTEYVMFMNLHPEIIAIPKFADPNFRLSPTQRLVLHTIESVKKMQKRIEYIRMQIELSGSNSPKFASERNMHEYLNSCKKNGLADAESITFRDWCKENGLPYREPIVEPPSQLIHDFPLEIDKEKIDTESHVEKSKASSNTQSIGNKLMANEMQQPVAEEPTPIKGEAAQDSSPDEVLEPNYCMSDAKIVLPDPPYWDKKRVKDIDFVVVPPCTLITA